MHGHGSSDHGSHSAPVRAAWLQGRIVRGALGAVIGLVCGGIACGLVEAAFTGNAYAGAWIGSLLGAFIGGQLGYGNGRRGVVLVLAVLSCSAVGALLPTLIRPPTPNDVAPFVPAAVGGVVGAFAGLAVACLAVRTGRGLP